MTLFFIPQILNLLDLLILSTIMFLSLCRYVIFNDDFFYSKIYGELTVNARRKNGFLLSRRHKIYSISATASYCHLKSQSGRYFDGSLSLDAAISSWHTRCMHVFTIIYDNKGVVGDLPNNLPLPSAWLYEMPRGHC